MDFAQDFSPALAGTDGYGDLLIENGDLQLIDGIGAITQATVQRMRTLQGEVFLDLQLGVPYFQSLLGQRDGLIAFEQALQGAILGTPGVTALTYWKTDLNAAERRLDVTFRATTQLGPVNWSGTITP